MTDLINRADAIEAMDERWGDIKRTNKRVAKGHEAVYLDMRATISALPSADAVPWSVADKIGEDRERLEERVSELEERLEWIPVSERLPEDGVEVLITTENEEVYIDQVITDPYKERYFQSNTGYDNFQVIAWMPLPEPYKAESEEV